MVTRKPAPTLKLSDAAVERPKVEFLIRSYVDQPADDGTLESVEQTSVELFQVKLHTELTLDDYEEINRVKSELVELLDQRELSEDGEWLAKLRFCFRQLTSIAFYDQVPREALGGLTLERLEEIVDFLSSVWPVNLDPNPSQAEPAVASAS